MIAIRQLAVLLAATALMSTSACMMPDASKRKLVMLGTVVTPVGAVMASSGPSGDNGENYSVPILGALVAAAGAGMLFGALTARPCDGSLC